MSHIPSLTPEGYTGYSGLPADGTLDVPFSGSAKIVSAPAFKLFGYSFNRPKLDRLSCAVKPPAIDPLEKAWQAPTKEAGNALFDALIFTNREDTLEGLKRDEVLGIISMRVYLEDNDWHFLERVMPYTIEKKRPDSLWRKRRWDLTRQAVDQLDYKAILRIEHPTRIRNIFENGGMRLPTAPLY